MSLPKLSEGNVYEKVFEIKLPIEIILAGRDFQGQELCEIMEPAVGIKEPVLN